MTGAGDIRAQKQAAAEYLRNLRPDIMAYALDELGSQSHAEEVVQDTLVAALKYAADGFAGKAVFKTWVYALLKRRIADAFRLDYERKLVRKTRKELPNVDRLFNHRGRWHPQYKPQPWDNPLESDEAQRFWYLFDQCLAALPEQQGVVFLMREYLSYDIEEISEQLGLAESHVQVILHRSRLQLQHCLTGKWFAEQ